METRQTYLRRNHSRHSTSKGLKFTMDDLAMELLGMSKKTIYTVFRDKESLILSDGRLSVRFYQRERTDSVLDE